jgi:hypothetical protein
MRQRAGFKGDHWDRELKRYIDDVRQTDPGLASDIESRLDLTSSASFEIGLDCLIEGIAGRFLRQGSETG